MSEDAREPGSQVEPSTPGVPSRLDGRKVRGEQRRERILATAIEVFGAQGFRGGSLREISSRVGISEAGLLHHFGSKERLLAATLAERDRRDHARRAAEEAVGVGLVDGLRHQVRRNAGAPGLVGMHVVVSAEATEAGHPAHAAFRDRYRRQREQDGARFAELVGSGELRGDIDPSRIVQLTSAVMDGLQLQWLLDPDEIDMPELFEHFLSLLGAGPERSADPEGSNGPIAGG